VKNTFQYSLLQYHHSAALGEVMNVGVLVLFPEQQQLRFFYPDRLTRLRGSYPNFPERVLKSYFKGIDARLKELNQQPEIFENYAYQPIDFINNEILVRDASALQFGSLKTAVLYSSDIDLVAKQIANLYLSLYEIDEDNNKRHDDEYLLMQFRKRIKLPENGSFFSQKIKENYSANGYQFPYAWKNGTLNLVDPVSFDLQKRDSIRRKADEHFGKFTKLQDFADANNIQFDVLVAQPKALNLSNEYDNALQTLKLSKHIRIWEESQLDEYTTKTLQDGVLF
jgi:hypothetical protein